MTVKIIVGDAEALPLKDKSVHVAITSPPYYGLRDYGQPGQIGLEESPEKYIERLVGVFREVWRVLRNDGTLWLNIGDSYAAGGTGGAPSKKSTLSRHGADGRSPYLDSMGQNKPRAIPEGCKPKDLIGIPWLLAFALRAEGWYLRSDIIWHKPNPMPESVRDRPTKAHEYLFLLTKSPRYYYDAVAIAEPAVTKERRPSGVVRDRVYGYDSKQAAMGRARGGSETSEPELRNKRTVWSVASQPFGGAHFATFPAKLITPCILAGSAPFVCSACGAPSVRMVERTAMVIDRSSRAAALGEKGNTASSGTQVSPAKVVTKGWQPSCDCAAGQVPATILDPFGGAGTTALAALQTGRSAIMVELNPKYAAIARKRLGDAAKPKAKPRKRPKTRQPAPEKPAQIDLL